MALGSETLKTKVCFAFQIESFIYVYDVLQLSWVKRTPQDYINEFIIWKLNPLVVLDFRFMSAFLHA